MGEKYKITTETGTYIVETEDAPQPSRGTVTVDEAKKAFAAQRTPDPRSGLQIAGDQVMNNLEGIGQFVAGIPSMAKETGVMLSEALNPLGKQPAVNRGVQMYEGLKSTLGPMVSDTGNLAKSLMGNRSDVPMSTPEQQRGYANFAGQNLAPLLLSVGVKNFPGAVQGVKEMIPSKERAGLNFQAVMGKAKDVPLELNMADDAALRAQELAGRGGLPGRGSNLPKVMRDYLRTRESQPVMTYEAGRDFQSAAGRLSSAEAQAANPVMKAQVSKLAKALADSNRQAAAKVGMGAEYDAAMAEYRRAARIAEVLQATKKHAAKAIIGSGAAYGIYKATGH